MKKSLFFVVELVAIVGLVSLTSCKKEETMGNGTQFRAAMEDCSDVHNAKTVLNGTALEWVAGDRVRVNGGSTTGVCLYRHAPEPCHHGSADPCRGRGGGRGWSLPRLLPG